MSNSNSMSKTKLVTQYVIAYISWIASFLLWLWFMILGRNALLGALGAFYIRGGFQRRLEAQLADRVFMLTTGIAWLIIMIVSEEYFRRGVKKGDLLKRISQVFAPIILLVFTADIIWAYVVGFEYQPWSRWLLLALELIAGIGLIWLARHAPGARKSSYNTKIE